MMMRERVTVAALLIGWAIVAAGVIAVINWWGLEGWTATLVALMAGAACLPPVFFVVIYLVVSVAWHTGRPAVTAIDHPDD